MKTEEESVVDEDWRLKRMSLIMEKRERGRELLMKSQRLKTKL
jgi:hypothetical protein